MWKYLRKYIVLAVLGALFMAGEVMIDLIQPKMMSIIVDEGVLGVSSQGVSNLGLILTTGGRMLFYIVLGGACGLLSGICTNVACMRFANDLRKEIFEKIMALSFEQTELFSTGSLITRITNDITQLQNLVGMVVRGFVRNLSFFAGGILCLMTLDLSFGAVVACAIPFLIVCIIVYIIKINPLFSSLQKKLDRVNSVMQENVTGARVVKAYTREEYEEQRFDRANQDLADTQLRILEMASFMSPVMNIVLNLSVIAVIQIGAVRVMSGSATPGNVMAAITYLSQILSSIMIFANIFQQFSRGMASYKRLWEVLDCEPVIVDGSGIRAEASGQKDAGSGAEVSGQKDAGSGAEISGQKDAGSSVEASGQKDVGSGAEISGQENGSVEFRNVSFSYPGGGGERILDHIDLKIRPGETLGIMGETGSGKSTLVHLIPRFYDVTEGEVLVDGVNVKEYPLETLRGKVAVTLQKSELFSETIEENIRWGKQDASEGEIQEAIRAAQAEPFISEKEAGLQTHVAEKGMSLSGGQKQRLSISRALLKKSKILILDDSTSALDLKTEAKLYEALNTQYRDVTKIIIAQRVASVKGADRIAVLDKGKIAACDTHENLLKNCPLYQDIYQSQLKDDSHLKDDPHLTEGGGNHE